MNFYLNIMFLNLMLTVCNHVIKNIIFYNKKLSKPQFLFSDHGRSLKLFQKFFGWVFLKV